MLTNESLMDDFQTTPLLCTTHSIHLYAASTFFTCVSVKLFGGVCTVPAGCAEGPNLISLRGVRGAAVANCYFRLGNSELKHALMNPTFNRIKLNICFEYRCCSLYIFLDTDLKLIFFSSVFWKNKSMLMRSPCCLCVCESPPMNFWMPERIFTKFNMHIMALEPMRTS
jgi:hypothetical protein